MKKMTSQLKRQGADVHVTLAGVLDERSELPEMDESVAGKLTVNLKDVSLINSLGCRKWIKWLHSLKAGLWIELEECSIACVNQMNILVGFLPESVQVRSCYISYYCESCAHEELNLFEIERGVSQAAIDALPEEKTCSRCGGVSDLDILKEHYFSFLAKKTA